MSRRPRPKQSLSWYRAWHQHPRHGFWHWVSLATASTLAAFVLISGWEVALREAAGSTLWGKVTVRSPVARAAAPQTFDLAALMRGEIPPYTIRSGHPRLFITPENKTQLIQRITGSELGRTSFQRLITIADNGIGTDFSAIAPDLNPRNAYPAFAASIEAYGVLNQLGPMLGVPEEEPTKEHLFQGFRFKHGLSAYRQKGVAAYLPFLQHSASLVGPHEGRFTELATGYDWLFGLLSVEQQQQAIRRMIEATTDVTSGVWPFSINDDPAGAGTTGHAYNSPYGMELLLPAAFSGDNSPMEISVKLNGLGGTTTTFTNSDAAAQYLLEILLTKTLWGPTGSLTRFYRLSNGVTEEEIGYAGRYSKFLPTLEGWYTATGQDFWQVGDGWKRFIQWHLYDSLPHTEGGPGPWYYPKMEQAKDGRMTETSNRYHFAAATGWLGRMDEDQLADVAAWAVRLPGSWTFSNNISDFFFAVLMGDPLRTPRSLREAGLEPSLILASPTARVFMRNRWGDADATFFMHAIAEWHCLRSNAETMNTIFLWKNGGTLLTHKSGYRHDYGYDNRYNIVRPYGVGDRPSLLTATFGGTGCPSRAIDTTKFTTRGGFLRAAKIDQGKYGYTAGDASKFLNDRTRVWPSPTGYITASDRQVIWFPSADGKDYFLLYDRVTTDGAHVQPHLIFNTVKEPVLSNDFDAPIAKDAMDSQVHGHWIAKNVPAITITNDERYATTRELGTLPSAHARLFFKVILPRSPVIHLTGGTANASGQWVIPQGQPNAGVDVTYGMEINDQLETTDFSRLNGEGATNPALGCGLESPCDSRTLDGLWRFFIANQNLKLNNRYLMAMEATDSSQPRPTGNMTLLEGQGLIGAAVANAIGLFNPVYQPLTAGTLTLPEGVNGTFRLLIADLNKNTSYTVNLAGTPQTLTSTDAGTVYIENVTLKSGDLMTIAQAGATPPPPCTPNWQCAPYSACSAQSTQTRTCTDANSCGTDANKPPESQACMAADGGGGAAVRGDLSGDGKVTYADVRIHFQMLVGMVTVDLAKADLDGDGRLTLADFRALLRLVVAQ